MVKGSASDVAATGELAFLARIADICSQSESLSWQMALQQSLVLFAEIAQARFAAVLLLDETHAPLACVPLESGSEILCTALANANVRWQSFKFSPGLSELPLKTPEVSSVHILPIPPNAVNCKTMIMLVEPAASAQKLLEKGAALLTPLMVAVRLCLLEQRPALPQLPPAPPQALTPEQMLDQIQELKRRQVYLESLNKVANVINSGASLDEALSVGIQQAVWISEMNRGAIYLMNQEDELELHAQCGFTPEKLPQMQVLRMVEEGGLRFVWKPRNDANVGGEDAYISMPLMIKNQIIGMMNLYGPETQIISVEVQWLLSSMADQLALAVQRGRLADQMREQVRYLYEISAAFLLQKAADGIIFLLLRSLTDAVEDTLIATFYRLKANGQWTRERVYRTRATPDPLLQKWVVGPVWEIENTFLNACRQEHMLVLASRQRGRTSTAWKDVELLGIHQIIYYPLFSSSEDFFGVASVMLAKDRPMAARDQLAWAVIQQASAAFMRIRLSEEGHKSENRLRAILESSRDGIFLLGNDLTVQYINGLAIRLLALPGDVIAWENRALSEVAAIIQGEAPRLASWLAQVVQDVNGRSLEGLEEEITFETAHGLIIKLQYKFISSTDESHSALPQGIAQVLRVLDQDDYPAEESRPALLLLLRDITEQRALEQMRDDLLSMLVHDMRSPLSVIQNAIQLLQDPAMGDVGDEVLNIAMNNTGKLLELVNTILEISRLESGRFELTQEAVYFPELVYEISREYILAMNQIDFRTSLPADLPLLWIDPAVVGRVLMNLLSNALKFVPPVGGIIHVSAILKGEWVTVEVYNNGPHIPGSIFKRLFQKFVAGDYEKRGYGLGLSFCKLAIEAHGGRIEPRNQHGGGVSFFFTLPVFRVPLDFKDDEAIHQTPFTHTDAQNPQ
ncbi:MAG: GAF domain-containing protein [Anaerolineae bacterium]|nr:GAF domain-containing protein [Anaerolineae bacterium]